MPERIVVCHTCKRNPNNPWRFGCVECAEHFAEYHRNAYDPAHDVDVRDSAQIRRKRERPWWEQNPYAS